MKISPSSSFILLHYPHFYPLLRKHMTTEQSRVKELSIFLNEKENPSVGYRWHGNEV